MVAPTTCRRLEHLTRRPMAQTRWRTAGRAGCLHIRPRQVRSRQPGQRPGCSCFDLASLNQAPLSNISPLSASSPPHIRACSDERITIGRQHGSDARRTLLAPRPKSMGATDRWPLQRVGVAGPSRRAGRARSATTKSTVSRLSPAADLRDASPPPIRRLSAVAGSGPGKRPVMTRSGRAGGYSRVESGGPTGIRTQDTRIKSPLLCR